MKLLWLTEHYYPHGGGMAQSCERIVSHLRALGVAIDLVHLTRRSRRQPNKETELGFDLRWPLTDAPAHGINLLWNWLEAQLQGVNSATQTYQGIVVFGAHYAPLAGLTFAKWLEIPLFSFARGNDFDIGVFDIKKRAFLQELYEYSNLVFCVSRDKQQKIPKLFSKAEAVWVSNGIELNQWTIENYHRRQRESLREKHIDPNKKVLGLFGHIKEKKGGIFLLESILNSGLAAYLQLLVVGDMEDETLAWVEENKSEVDVVHIPFVERSELIPYYLLCHSVVIPSFYDGTPNVLLEAGMLKVPVLAANVAGMKDLLAEERAGVLFEPGDFHQLRYALEHLVHGDYKEWLVCADRFQQMIVERHSAEREATQYQEYFQQHLKP